MSYSRNYQVKDFFNQPHLYQAKNSNILIRSQLVYELLGDVENVSVLDIGCGDGSISLQFAHEKNFLLLADLSPKMLALARESTPAHLRQQVSYYEGDFQHMPTSNQFDIVLCLGVLAHVPSMPTALKKAAALTKPGGRLIIQFTDDGKWLGHLVHGMGAWRESHDSRYYYPLNRINQQSIKSLLTELGVELVGARQYWPQLPGMGRLPLGWSYRYQLSTLRHSMLARFGCETIFDCCKHNAYIDHHE